MNIQKQRLLELTLYLIFFLTNFVLYRGIYMFSNFWISFLIISLFVITNIATLGLYSAIQSDKNNTFIFISIHTVIILLFVFLYNINPLNILIITLSGALTSIFIGSFIRQVEIEIKERLTYSASRIIFPHIKKIIMCFIVLSTVVFYFKMYDFYDQSKSEIKISDTFIKTQINFLEPLIKRSIPNFTEEITIGEIIEGNISKNIDDQNKIISENINMNLENNANLRGLNLENLSLNKSLTIESQIFEINTQLGLEDKIKYDTNVVKGLSQILNNLIQNFVNKVLDSNKFALILSGLFFSIFSILVPIYSFFIKYVVLLLEKICLELNFIKIKSEVKQKETITY